MKKVTVTNNLMVNSPDGEVYFTIDQVARSFLVSKASIRRWLKGKAPDGRRLEGTRFGRQWRISRSAIEKFKGDSGGQA